MIEPTVPPEVPKVEEDYDKILEWTIEEEEAFLAILSKASNEEDDL